MVFIVLAIGLLFGLAGLAVDMVYTYAVKVRLVTAVDSTALGIARALGRGVTQSDQSTEVLRTSSMLFDANFPQQYMLTGSSPQIVQGPTIAGPNVTPSGSVFENDPEVEVGMREVRLTGQVMVPMFFFRMFGVDALPVRASARAARRDVNVMMVLDRSSSMAAAGAWAPLQNAAVFFLNQFDNNTDNLGIVSYGTNARVDLPIGTGFKTGQVGENIINGQLVPNNGAATNAPWGLWMGYAELLSLSTPDALNVMVFFTDGNPTAFTNRFSVRRAPLADPRCVDSLDGTDDGIMEAAILTFNNTDDTVTNMAGFVQPIAPYPAILPGYDYDYYQVNGPAAGVEDKLCTGLGAGHLASNVEDLFTTGCFPTTWQPTYKNTPATGPPRSYNAETTADLGVPYGVDNCDAGSGDAGVRGRYVHRTAKTFSINVVNDARDPDNELGGVIIYSIGLGNIDPDFLRRVANDADSPNHDATQTEGKFVNAPSAAQLQQAFQQVANEIFRLIQ
jgi:hypothetical protein